MTTEVEEQLLSLGEKIHSFFYKKEKGPIWGSSTTINAFQESKESEFFGSENGCETNALSPTKNQRRVSSIAKMRDKYDMKTIKSNRQYYLALPHVDNQPSRLSRKEYTNDNLKTSHGANRRTRSSLENSTNMHMDIKRLRRGSKSVSPYGLKRMQPPPLPMSNQNSPRKV